jgi:hypothetical protein
MPENHIEGKQPLWLLIEKEIQNYKNEDFSDANSLETSKKISTKLDETGYNVSKSAGNWLQLKMAVEARTSVGRPFIKDFDQAIADLTLDDIEDTYITAMKVINNLGKDWSSFLASENRPDVDAIVQNKKIELVTAKAKDLGGKKGIRLLISESFEPQKIVEIMGVSENEYKEVKSKVDAEFTEIERVKELLTTVSEASEEEKIKHLFNENVADELIKEIGAFEQSTIDSVKKAMEAELAEKKKKEEEEAAQKAAEAAGPSLDEISSDDMLEYIEGIREILDFADSEKDIRIMCEQSSIPKALVDIAVSDPDKLDELEKQAEG